MAEDGMAKASALLGIDDRRPVDVFVYGDRASFYQALGPDLPGTVGGLAIPEIRTLFVRVLPDLATIIPHELTHIVFDGAVRNTYHAPAHWLDEGFAVYLAQGYDASDRSDVAAAATSGELMPLGALVGEFPPMRERFSLAYAESVSAVDFIVRTRGQAALVKLVRSYAQGMTDDEAFSGALGMTMSAFSDAWLNDIGAKAPTRYGPQAAPAGPLPPGWTNVAAGATGAYPGDSAMPGNVSGSGEIPPGGSPVPAAPVPAGDGSVDPVVVGGGALLVAVGAAVSMALGLRRRRRRVRGATEGGATEARDDDGGRFEGGERPE